MKKAAYALLILAAASVAAIADPAADAAKAQTDAAKALATRQNTLCKAIAQQVKDKVFTNFLATAEELLASTKGAEPPAMTRGSAAFVAGKALVVPLNLRYLKEAREYLGIAEKESPSAFERAYAKFLLLELDAKTCPDADCEAAVAALKAFFDGPALDELPPVEHVNFLYETLSAHKLPFDLDLIAMADKAAGTNADARALFYGGRYRGAIRKMAGAVNDGSLDPAVSREARLALIDRALADPCLPSHANYPEFKSEVLVELGRYDEAEKFLLDGIAHTNFQLNVGSWYELLGKFYDTTSKRYYAEPNAELRRKAIDAYRKAIDAKPPARNSRGVLADLCIAAGDVEGAKYAIDSIVENLRGQTNGTVLLKLGALAFAQEDYAGAAEFLGKVEKPDLATREKLATALYAEGRYADCLPHLEILAKETRNRYRRPYFQLCLEKAKALSEK